MTSTLIFNHIIKKENIENLYHIFKYLFVNDSKSFDKFIDVLWKNSSEHVVIFELWKYIHKYIF